MGLAPPTLLHKYGCNPRRSRAAAQSFHCQHRISCTAVVVAVLGTGCEALSVRRAGNFAESPGALASSDMNRRDQFYEGEAHDGPRWSCHSFWWALCCSPHQRLHLFGPKIRPVTAPFSQDRPRRADSLRHQLHFPHGVGHHSVPGSPGLHRGHTPATGTQTCGLHLHLHRHWLPAPTFRVSTDALPAGMSLNTTTGVLSGTPTKAGKATFTVTANQWR